jgi:hypothetical protein
MRMAVDARGLSVGGPSGVGDGSVRNESSIKVGLGVSDELLELLNLSNFLECENLALLISVNRYTC